MPALRKMQVLRGLHSPGTSGCIGELRQNVIGVGTDAYIRPDDRWF